MNITTEFGIRDKVYGLVVKQVPIPHKVGCAFCDQTGKLVGHNKKEIDCPECTPGMLTPQKTETSYIVSKQLTISGVHVDELSVLRKKMEQKEYEITYQFKDEEIEDMAFSHMLYHTPVFKTKKEAQAAANKRSVESGNLGL